MDCGRVSSEVRERGKVVRVDGVRSGRQAFLFDVLALGFCVQGLKLGERGRILGGGWVVIRCGLQLSVQR